MGTAYGFKQHDFGVKVAISSQYPSWIVLGPDFIHREANDAAKTEKSEAKAIQG